MGIKRVITFSILLLVKFVVISNGEEKPHIITVLIDDLGWNDVGFHGSDQISTPNIDALAYSGMILNRHYVLPTCTPSRASLLTGSYPIRTGMQGYPMKCGTRRGIPLSEKLKPAYLKDLGYHTHLVGKWHLGYHSPEYLPNSRGFDTFFGYYNGYIEYFTYGIHQSYETNGTFNSYYGYDLHSDNEVDWKAKGKYATHTFTKRVSQIIQNHNNSEPLYLLISHLGVHTGSDEGTGLEIPLDLNVDELYSHIKDRPRREFAGVLEEVDKSVGHLVKALNDNNMLENSIILIISDNGGHTVSTDMNPNWSSNWPLRGMKFNTFEGGVRGSALIWSTFLPKGVVSEQFLHISDWLPTFYSAAGGNVNDLGKKDGKNQWKALKELTPTKRSHILLNIDEVEGEEAIIIKDRWKLKKGGLKKYSNYDYHWGEEVNISPSSKNYYSKVKQSITGRKITKIKGFEKSLVSKKMETLRKKSRIECNFESDTFNISNRNGFVNESREFFCTDFCIFDLINDPCELTKIENKKILEKGIKYLNRYKKNLLPQKDNAVDPLSDPKNSGGVWLPWLHKSNDFWKSFFPVKSVTVPYETCSSKCEQTV